MYNIHGFNFKNEKEITDLVMSEANLCEKEKDILDRMIEGKHGLRFIDHFYSELSRACVAYYLGEDATKDQEDELLGEAWEEWAVYTVNNALPGHVISSLLDAESVQEAREALEDYES